jgi:hypothetical protein
MYSPGDYLWMIADDVRVTAYGDTIRALVRPGDVVLEIGAGFGFFSVLAARHGAGHVYAVESNPAIHLGPHVANANGCSGRITFHHGDVAMLQLPRTVDLVISDLRGATPFSGRALAVIADVRRRLARRGATFIAAADTLYAAPCSAPAVFRSDVQAVHGRERLDLTPVERVVLDTPLRCAIDPGDLLAPGQVWCRIQYASLETSDYEGSGKWTLERDAQMDGIAVWFSTDLGGGVGFTSAPGSAVRSYRQLFLPLRAPLSINAGDTVRIHLGVRLVRNDCIWEWMVWARSRHANEERLVANQNSLAELVIDASALRQAAT